MRHPKSLFALLLLFTLALPAEAQKGPEKLEKKELAARLTEAREKVFEKMVPEQAARRDGRTKKWLDSFMVVQSKHYLVFTNGPKKTSKKFATSLEKLYKFVQKQWPFEDVDHHLKAYIFKSKEEYFDFCVKITGWSMAQARKTAGHATGAYYATFYQSPTADAVMHEATHQIIHACHEIVGVGSWFQEGVAVYIECKIGNRPPSATMRTDFRNGDFYELDDFLKIRTLLSDPNGHGLRNYRHAGSLIDFLVNSRDKRVRGKFPEFLAAAQKHFLRGHKGSAALIKQVYQMTVPELGQAWKEHHGVPKAKPRDGGTVSTR